jgi:hypothetical protein
MVKITKIDVNWSEAGKERIAWVEKQENLSSNLKKNLVLTAAIEKKEENSKPRFEHFGVFGDKDLVWTASVDQHESCANRHLRNS